MMDIICVLRLVVNQSCVGGNVERTSVRHKYQAFSIAD